MRVLLFKQSSGCTPCTILSNILKYDFNVEIEDTIDLLNPTNEQAELAAKYGIMTTPATLLIGEDGTELKRVVGVDKEGVGEILKLGGLI